jgi:hypothetical protein
VPLLNSKELNDDVAGSLGRLVLIDHRRGGIPRSASSG